jgi:hypothetical protein
MDKAQPYWFYANRNGWGWGPATWQGWLVIVAWLSIFLWGLRVTGLRAHPWTHAAYVAAMLGLLALICYLKGEPARWRWGGNK